MIMQVCSVTAVAYGYFGSNFLSFLAYISAYRIYIADDAQSCFLAFMGVHEFFKNPELWTFSSWKYHTWQKF